MQFEKRIFWELQFRNDVEQSEQKRTVPLLINKKNQVVLGNCFRESFEVLDEIDCLLLDDPFEEKVLSELERMIMLECDRHRQIQIQEEIRSFIIDLQDKTEHLTLFELPKEDKLITKENYIKPPTTHTEKRSEEVIINATLFGNDGNQ